MRATTNIKDVVAGARQLRGVNATVARALGVSAAHVSRVSRGERVSPRIMAALEHEISQRLSSRPKSRGEGAAK